MGNESNYLSGKRLFYACVFIGIGALGSWAALGQRAKSAARPASAPVASPQNVRRDEPPPVERKPALYSTPPVVDSYAQGRPDSGQYLTVVRFNKSDGPWEVGRPSTFDLWFDGDVEQEFDSRGFADPVAFDVKVPEPRHFAITISSPPIENASYVAFSFTSARQVSLTRAEASPKVGGMAEPAPDGGSPRAEAGPLPR